MAILYNPMMVVPVMKKHTCVHSIFWIDMIVDREVSRCQTMVRKIAVCHFVFPRRSVLKCLSSRRQCCAQQENENTFTDNDPALVLHRGHFLVFCDLSGTKKTSASREGIQLRRTKIGGYRSLKWPAYS